MRYFLLIQLLCGCAQLSMAQPCNLTLTGHIEDADTHEKLVGAVVLLSDSTRSIVADEKGNFIFKNICAGTYRLKVTHINCEPIERTIELAKDMHVDIFLPHAMKTLGEVTVQAQKGIANSGFKKELKGTELEQTRGLSFAEALGKINGVTILQTGSTISKPVIHGLHSSRILTINNGVRQEGQQWGNEHAPEIDPFIADKLTIIKGVDELKYGSDAIGGVILVDPRPLREKPGYAAEINTAYFTNNRQYVVSGVFEQQLKKLPAFRYRIQGTFKKGANAATPDYRLNNTGSEEKNFSLTANWKRKRFNTELFYSLFATKLGIFTGSHIGNLTDLQNAIASSKPNDVFLGENTYRIRRPYQQVTHQLIKSKTAFYYGEHKFNVLVAGQFNHRREYDIVRSSTNNKPQLDLSIFTISEDINWEHPRKNGFSGTAGISGMQQDNSYAGRYFIPNYFAYSLGAYAIEKWTRHQWELQAGLRYDHKTINTNRLKFNGDTINYDFNFSTFAASFNSIYKPSPNWKLNSGIGLSTRAPYVNELLSDGIHHGTATYERGDISLKPEKAVHLSLGIEYQNSARTIGAEMLLYSNLIRDFIYQQPRPNEPVLTIAGAFPLIEYAQTDALLTGMDLSGNFNISKSFSWASKVSVLYARNRLLGDWLILMPANRLSNEITYTLNKDTYFSAEVMNVLRQSRVPSDKNGKQDYKAPPPGYTLVNFNASTIVNIGKTPVTLGLGIRNLFNINYRDYLNSMRYFADEMGRNIGLRIKIPLEKTPE